MPCGKKENAIKCLHTKEKNDYVRTDIKKE